MGEPVLNVCISVNPTKPMSENVCVRTHSHCPYFEPALQYKLLTARPDWRIRPGAGWCGRFWAWPGCHLSACSSWRPLGASWALSPADSMPLLFPSTLG